MIVGPHTKNAASRYLPAGLRRIRGPVLSRRMKMPDRQRGGNLCRRPQKATIGLSGQCLVFSEHDNRVNAGSLPGGLLRPQRHVWVDPRSPPGGKGGGEGRHGHEGERHEGQDRRISCGDLEEQRSDCTACGKGDG